MVPTRYEEGRSLSIGLGQCLDITTYINGGSWAKWKRLTERVSFHKLTYMKDKVPAKVEGSYYEYILK